MFFEKNLGVHWNIGVQRDSKKLLLNKFSMFLVVACEFGFKVSKSANVA
jgi:hypothetical protein